MKDNNNHEHKHVHPADTHTHKHAHEKGKDDQHTHEVGNDELNMLNILLDHWVNHNEDHAKDFYKWYEKANEMGKSETAEAIMDAIAFVKKVNESLVIAKEKMK